MATHQQLLKDFLMEVKVSGRVLVGKQAALEAFAKWLDDRQVDNVKRQREKSDSYIVPVQAVAVKYRGDGNE